MWFGGVSEGTHHKILELSWSLAALRDLPDLASAAAELMDDIVGADYLSFTLVDASQRPLRTAIYPQAVRSIISEQDLSSAVGYHPALHVFSAQGARAVPVRTEDIIRWPEFVRTRAYSVLCKPHNLRHQLLIPVRCDPASATATAYTINRCARSFTDDDLATGYALQSVLVAHHSVRTATPVDDARVEDVRRRLGLTVREAEVLDLVAQGLTAGAIGHVLRLSRRTVHKHLENAYAALGVHDRMRAVAKCRHHGLVR
jgi:DNA-binding CsgD family transcriptional regulator